MAQRITVDPITRIEGHLRVDCEVDDGKITNAWASGTMWRGVEVILQDRDPRDAWVFTQRICGVCTTVHAITSVRAVENALDMEVPLNAQFIRNMIQAAHGIHDHIVHFYHLSALDWVDLVSALKADPKKTAQIAQSLSDWQHNGASHFKAVQERLKAFVESGQLGIYENGYWGHEAMKLSPEVNLLAAAHYLQALEYQRKVGQIVTILGSKNPHIQNLAVGGVTNPINFDSQSTLTLERLQMVRDLMVEVRDFVLNAYVVDVAAIGAMYADWTNYGAGVMNYLSTPDMPMDTRGKEFSLPGGYLEDGDLATFKPISAFGDQYLKDGVEESTKHSWYKSHGRLHPYDGKTEPEFTDWSEDAKYSWLKSPTFYKKRCQVGPLPNVFAMVAAGHEGTINHLNNAMKLVSAVAGAEVPLTALHSTIGRHAARAVRSAVLADEMLKQWDALIENVGKGDFETFNRPEFPKGEVMGFGMHEAPRGLLSHWTVIQDGKIKNYQCVVPTTWNAGPRDEDDQISAYEASLLDNPVADPERPLEVLRTVHSFDPCLACAVHMVDKDRKPLYQVKVL